MKILKYLRYLAIYIYNIVNRQYLFLLKPRLYLQNILKISNGKFECSLFPKYCAIKAQILHTYRLSISFKIIIYIVHACIHFSIFIYVCIYPNIYIYMYFRKVNFIVGIFILLLLLRFSCGRAQPASPHTSPMVLLTQNRSFVDVAFYAFITIKFSIFC